MYILFGWKAQSLAQHSWFVGYLKFWFLSFAEGVNIVKTSVQIHIYRSFLKISHINWFFVFRIKAHCDVTYFLATEILSLKFDWNIPFFWVCNIILPTGNKPSVKWKGFEFWPLLTRKRQWVFPFIVKISQWSILGQKGAHGINVVY